MLSVNETAPIARLRAEWAECERTIYAISGMDTSRYENALRAVRACANLLREVGEGQDLAALWQRAEALLAPALAAQGVPPDGAVAQRILGASFALHDRESAALAKKEDFRARVAQARQDGLPWVMLEEKGRLDDGMMNPYHAVDMHVATGLALCCSTAMDPAGGRSIYTLTVVRLNSDSGEVVDVEPGVEDWFESFDPEELRRRIQALREHIAGT